MAGCTPREQSRPEVAHTTVTTVGHGTLPSTALLDLLAGAGIREVVDVRAFPGSRRNPQYGRAALEAWLPAGGIGYRWLPDLGGRRRPVEGSKHVALRHRSFRAYADHMESAAFDDGVDELLATAARVPVAVMCSESLWWRCHRRLLADHLELARGVAVEHLMHNGRRNPHRPTEGVRQADGGLVYDVGAARPLFDGPVADQGSGGHVPRPHEPERPVGRRRTEG